MPITDELLHGLSNLNMTAQQVARDITVLHFTIVNAFIVISPDEGEWVLVDTGLANSAGFIIETVKRRFGENSRPASIILTHGHFDHIGSVIELSDKWDVPVYAHELEMPYITGKKNYPRADPTVDEGLVAKMSPLFPHGGIDLSYRAASLNPDGSLPGMTSWRWIHTPGHTPGHVSLFREVDRVLISGDALTTTKQESLWSVLTQRQQIKGPPAYLTTDWKAAQESVKHIKSLNPSMIIPSHGQPVKGEELSRHLEMLSNNFNDMAVPEHGRFVDN